MFLTTAQNVAEAQDDYVYKTITCRKGDTLRSESPVSTASTLSKTETMYKMGTDIRLCEGDLITGVTFKGYNLGEEKTRHISVWIKQDYELGRLWNFTPTDKMQKVYDGDCKILHGGTADHLENILDIVFSTPVAYVNPNNFRMTIISEGEASSDSVFFLHTQENFVECIYATAGEDGQLCDPIKSSMPFATFSIATPVRYVSGTVTDEDGKGVVGATIRLRGQEWEETNYEGITDVEGKYRIRIEEGNKTYSPDVSAPGHTSYYEVMGFPVKENPIRDFTLYGSVTYPAHEQSSIILPVAPDATIGKYYKLVRREGKRFIFEREPLPQANVPYILFADRDYKVDLADMDLSITPGRIDLDSLSIVGSYSNGIYDFASYIDRDIDANSTTGTAMHAHLYGHYSLLLYNDYKLVFVDSIPNTLQRGDANGDGNLTVADMTAIAHYVLGYTLEGFSETAADANQDGQVNVADYTAVAHLLLYGSIERPANARVDNVGAGPVPARCPEGHKESLRAGTGPAPTPATDTTMLDNTVYISPATAIAGKEAVLSVCMKNAVEAEGFQFTLTLPEGVSVVRDAEGFAEASLSTERTTKEGTNTFATSLQPDGTLKVMGASTNGSAIKAGDGEVCTVRIKVDADMAEGDYTLQLSDVAISDTNAKSYDVEPLEATLTVHEASGISARPAGSQNRK